MPKRSPAASLITVVKIITLNMAPAMDIPRLYL